ncbi:hypothetical protein AB3M93_19575 [Novosphingobium panipatense]|uniref:hypothetical protein n=1 Tax=Novosphingobium panipatense TaxID=428991 RepID=UPI0039A2CD9E
MASRRILPPLLSLAAIVALAQGGAVLGEDAPEDTQAQVIARPGCNASAFAQLPRDPDLFIGRQLLTADGQLAPPAGAQDCSGGNPDNEKAGKSFNRWSLMLDRFDWKAKKFEVVKPLIDTSVDPATGHSRARITAGPMKGAVIRSAYDPSVVIYKDVYYVAYECTIEDGARYGAAGTSSCISVFEPRSRTIDFARTRVLVNGAERQGVFWAAAVPLLLELSGKLYLYWSAGARRDGQIVDWRVRSAEISVDEDGPRIKGSGSRPVHSMTSLGQDVWRSGHGTQILDLFNVFRDADTTYALFASGGRGCSAPSSAVPDCYRLSVSKVTHASAAQIIDTTRLIARPLPVNAVEYPILVRDPQGRVFLMGHFLRPRARSGMTMPDMKFWSEYEPMSVYAMVPFFH